MSEKTEDAAPKGLVEVLKQFPGSPSQEQVEQWKMKHGDVYVSGFSETELYIWKSLTRSEWISLQMALANPENKIDQFKFEEMVCESCILWKSVSGTLAEGKAGTAASLQEQIMQNSNFLTPQAASMLVAKL